MFTMIQGLLTALLCYEAGQLTDDYMLLLALIAFAAVVMVFVLGPQVTMVYAHANSGGGY